MVLWCYNINEMQVSLLVEGVRGDVLASGVLSWSVRYLGLRMMRI